MPKKHLVIVESPTKARTIGRYLGPEYEVAASVGHVRDLPRKELGVDVDAGFEPTYVTIRGKGKVLTELRRKAKGVESVILATDPDREGEAIAFHVAEQLGYRAGARGDASDRFHRIQFREITRNAVREALKHPVELDMRKVEAQQARRILDRLVGYKVSPFLWKPIRQGLSAGRVQTVALRLICEREDEVRAFEAEEYWSVTAHLVHDDKPFDARLHKIDGKAFRLGTEVEADAVLEDVRDLPFRVSSVKRRERRKNPAPPFTTSTLQQEASRRLRFSARRTMTTAQKLYEGVTLGRRGAVGLITYMRTDSTRISAGAVQAARAWIAGEMGAGFVSSSPRYWSGKQQKGAQEAHEAIRPSDPTIHPAEASRYLPRDAAKLYELVWLRFVASQMAPAVYDTTTVDFDLEGGTTGRGYLFRATGSVVKFPGFTRLYLEARETGDRRRLDDLEELPVLDRGDVAEVNGIEPRKHFTQPPPRFSEATLVKELERRGIGRPSTYADIIGKIQDRGYVRVETKRFVPTELGEVVARLLVRVFPDIFDIEFTGRMEGELDRVEDGSVQWRTLLGDFYPRLRERLARGEEVSEEIVKEILEAEGEACEKCGEPMLVRWNKHGRFLGCSAYPECATSRPVDAPETPDEPLGTDPESGHPVLLKNGPYGPYVERIVDGEDKPRRVSVPEGRQVGEVDLDYALRLLSLPRSLGTDPTTGEDVVAGLGRYGPYVRRGETYADLPDADAMFTVGLREAVELVERKKKGGKRVLKDLGVHAGSGNEIRVLSGKYGPYVSDGNLNVSLPGKMEPRDVTMDRAIELLTEKASRGGRGGGSRGRGRRGRRGRRGKGR